MGREVSFKRLFFWLTRHHGKKLFCLFSLHLCLCCWGFFCFFFHIAEFIVHFLAPLSHVFLFGLAFLLIICLLFYLSPDVLFIFTLSPLFSSFSFSYFSFSITLTTFLYFLLHLVCRYSHFWQCRIHTAPTTVPR